MKERMIDRIMNREVQAGSVRLKIVDLAFMLCLFLFAFLIRYSLFPIESADYFGFLEPWMGSIRANGGYRSLALSISNYTSPYMYIMTLLSYSGGSDLYALKLVSVCFDYLGAFGGFLILHRLTGSVRKGMMGMAGILLLPTAVINSAWWCQHDMIYTAFLLFAFYFFLKDESGKSLFFFGLGFAFKLQSLFFLPFFIMMWLKGRTVKLRHVLWLPAIYVLSNLPAVLLGRDFKDVMSVYFSQSGYYPWGTLEYPNIYALLGEAMPDMRHAAEISGAGVFMTVMLLGCIAYYLYTKDIRLSNELLVTLALFTVAAAVYCLPHMHERYGFLIDVLAVIYGVQRGKRFPAACGFSLISLLSSMPYLIAVPIIPLPYLAIMQLGLLLFVGYDLYRLIQENLTEKTPDTAC